MNASKRTTTYGPLLVLLSMVFLYQADATIVNVASPSIQADLHASGAVLELVISGYLMTSAAVIVIGARLGHLYGFGRIFGIGVAVFGVASLACGLAQTPAQLVAARVVQGVGGALAFPQVLTGIQVSFAAGPQRTRALGWYSAALAAGAVSGQLAGGLLVSADIAGLGWRPIFLVNGPITLVTLVAAARAVPRGDCDRSTRLDVPGAAALFLTVLAVVAPLSLGRDAGWPVWTWMALALAAPLFAAFALVERRRTRAGRAPLVDLDLVWRPAIARALWPQALTTATYWGLLLILALYLQGGLGYSPLASGLTLLPWVIAFAIPGRVMHLVPTRLRWIVPSAGALLLAAAYVLLSVAAFAGVRSEAALLPTLAVGGLGLGTVFNSMLVRLTSVTPGGRAADTSGISATTMQVSGAIGVAVFGALYLGNVGGRVAAGMHAFGLTTAAFAGVAVCASGLAYRAMRTGTTTAPSPG